MQKGSVLFVPTAFKDRRPEMYALFIQLDLVVCVSLGYQTLPPLVKGVVLAMLALDKR